MGSDYSGFVETEAEFVEKFLTLVQSAGHYAAEKRRVQSAASQFTFDSHRLRLLPQLTATASRTLTIEHRFVVLWVGHDFKFLKPVQESIRRSGRFMEIEDRQEGHTITHPMRSLELLSKADLIFCEWCLGNAEWYSKHKTRRQKLVIRLHRQELETPYLEKIQWENVDRIIFISEWVKEHFLLQFPAMAGRAVLIHNAVNCTALDQEKLPGAEFDLGLLGYCPKLKAPHRAFEILSLLRRSDPRYTLFIKGVPPQQLDWLWKREEERRYYADLYKCIDDSSHHQSVVFEPHGADIANWFSKIGFILSTSDYEGSHQAVAEGMASGAVPVIRDWFGANRMYPTKYIYTSQQDATALLKKWRTLPHYEEESRFCRSWAQRFDQNVIARSYLKLFDGLASGGVDAT